MHDVRAPWLILCGMAVVGFVMISMGLSGMTSAEFIKTRVPVPEGTSPEAWQVLDEARRITEQAAAEEA